MVREQPLVKTGMARKKLESPPPEEQVLSGHLPGKYIGYSIENYFSQRFPFLDEAAWLAKIAAGDIRVNGVIARSGMVLREHDFLETRMGIRREPPADRDFGLVYEDRHLRVFNKGAPLPVHPCGRYFKNSMTEILKTRYPEETPRPVQRLDALTTGLVVFARTRAAAGHLMHEFAGNRVEKVYLALVEGAPEEAAFVIDQPVGKVIGSARGVGNHLHKARPARTRVETLVTQSGRSLLRVVPETGRTNQIRVHLAHAGLPLVNDPVYGKKEHPEEDLGLHAWKLGFLGPDRRLDLTAPWPDHFEFHAQAAGLATGGAGE